MNRLTQAIGNYGTKTFSYDQLGNLLTKDGLTYTYSTSGGRPHAVSGLSDGTTFTYDADGNMSNMTKAGIPTDYVYDTENRLKEVKKSGASVSLFEYDGDGGRTKKTLFGTNPETIKYIGSLYEDTGTRSTKHIFLGGTEVASITNGQLIYYHADHLGGTNVTTSSTGTKKELCEYLPFGGFSRHEKYGSSDEVAWFYFVM